MATNASHISRGKEGFDNTKSYTLKTEQPRLLVAPTVDQQGLLLGLILAGPVEVPDSSHGLT